MDDDDDRWGVVSFFSPPRLWLFEVDVIEVGGWGREGTIRLRVGARGIGGMGVWMENERVCALPEEYGFLVTLRSESIAFGFFPPRECWMRTCAVVHSAVGLGDCV